ncbi:MAG: pyrroline-5-carboxylate reductase [Burkholderiales bacterium]
MTSESRTTSVTFIGGGNMACALIGGLLQRGYEASQFHVVEISEGARQELERKFGVRSSATLPVQPLVSGVVVLAVKPQQLREVALSLAPLLRTQLVLTIAAGVRSADLSRWLGNYGRIARAMPNTPALVLAGVSALYAMPEVDAAQRLQAEQILACVGSVIWLDDETQLDAVTAVSGSGPAYVFYFMEAMEEAARELGLNAQQSKQLVLDTFAGAAKLASASEEPVAVLRARVTSKGGTTERALSKFDEARLKQHIVAAVIAAAERSRALGDTFGQPA